MKTGYLITLILPLLILLNSGCHDFLDIKPKGKDIPEKIAHYDGLFNNTILSNLTYSKVTDNGGTTFKATELYYIYMSDELTADAASFANMGRAAQAAYTYDPDIFLEEDYSAEWSAAYQHIYLYNVIAGGVMDAEDGTSREKKELLAEARVGRAYMHFYLAQLFCKPYHKATAARDAGIPIVTKANSGETGFSRETVQKVYEFITTELEQACPDLKPQTQHRQRIYQAAGYYMLGKVYLTMGEYEKALGALNKALKATENTTVSLELFDYNQKITEWGYMGSSAIWGLSCAYPTNFDENNNELIYNKQINIMPLVFFVYPPMVYVKPEYMALYSRHDHRSKFFSDTDYTGVTQWPYFRRVCRMTYTMAGDMADLYLMLAECKARTEDEDGARADLLTLRQHRMPQDEAVIPADINTKEKLIRFIIDERKREYIMTGLLWFDQRRLWNDPLFQQDKAKYTHTDGQKTYTLTEDRLTYRIPPKVLLYNQGWEDNK